MKPFLFVLFFCGSSLSCALAADNYPIGGRSAGVANASVTYADLWSAFNNQAGLAGLKYIEAGAYYENKFLISDLNLRGAVIDLPMDKAGVFALSVTRFGGELYNETKTGLAFAKRLGEKFSAGIQLNYLSTHIANDDDGFNYGNRNVFTVEGGIIAEPLKDFKIGVHLFNPNQASLASYADEHVPTIMKFGASYKFSDKVLLSSEMEKDIEKEDIFKTGLEYHIVEQAFLRMGIATNPSIYSFGFGCKFSQFQIDVASSYHQVLGFSPQVSLTYNFTSQ